MILFFNTYIAPGGVGLNYERGFLKQQDKIDILKYSLSSFSKIYPWSKVILNIGLDSSFEHRREELKTFINTEFENKNLILEWNRISKQKEWQEKYHQFDDHVIWYCGNHDHIYIDNNFDYLNKLITILNNSECSMMSYSHFPEFIRNSHIAGNPVAINEYSIEYMSGDIDAVHILTKDLYYKWWFGKNVSNYDFPRPDWYTWLRAVKDDIPEARCIVPYRELCRHFDGYTAFKISNNICPALEIPDGFFNNEIKINHGTFEKKNGYVNLNPLNKNYKAYDLNGTDYKFNLEDIPSFWQNRISAIEKHNVDKNLLIKCRLNAIFDMFNFENYKLPKEIKERIQYFYES
jgi:hypothetical protein